MQQAKATVIISVYRDVVALQAILFGLSQQSEQYFQVIVSEDGCSEEMALFMGQQQLLPAAKIAHLTQEDCNFRKNRALNRAIAHATTQKLLFIDGDCIPQQHFIQSHLRYLQPGVVTAARRVELGPDWSTAIRVDNRQLHRLNSNSGLLKNLFSLQRDQTKHLEKGLYLPLIQPVMQHKRVALLGCNFGACRSDLLAVNGFNELYEAPGYGEDSDIEVRLRRNGVQFSNLSMSALQFHLYHPRRYQESSGNRQLYNQTRSTTAVRCEKGVSEHLTGE